MGCPTAGRAAGATNWVLIGVAEPSPHGKATSVSVSVGARRIERGGADDCAIWKGAIGGDGYGRYWVGRGCSERIMVRANRYALAAAQDGVALEPSVRALHGCDNTVCVRVSRLETGLLHVVGGSQRDNMEMMGRARRGGGRPAVRRGMAGLAQRRARAVALRDAVRDGWDADAVAQALLTLREPTLW